MNKKRLNIFDVKIRLLTLDGRFSHSRHMSSVAVEGWANDAALAVFREEDADCRSAIERGDREPSDELVRFDIVSVLHTGFAVFYDVTSEQGAI